MFLIGLGTATPPRQYAQREGWDALIQSETFHQLTPRSQAILKKVLLGQNGISTRFLALDSLKEAFEISPDVLHDRFRKHAPAIAAAAARRALEDAKLDVACIDAVIISTCTGYLCPGLTSYVAESIGLREDVLALDLVGQGCGAALPNLRMGEALLSSGRNRYVLSICVEICSAAFYLDNDPGVLISACLFGDGAGAVILSQRPEPTKRRIHFKAFGSLLNPAERDTLRFEQRDGMLRNILRPQVPALAGKHARRVLDNLLLATKVQKSQISAWILHAGGREILGALRDHLELPTETLCHSARVLSKYGNVSSPCVFFVLESALADRMPGGWWCMSSFGAGFSCHGALLEVD
jgi:predicted naringenin-chalcone synthase